MRAALFTSFPQRFINEKILPDLSRRGVDVVLVDETSRVGRYDLRAYKLDVVLHMNEMGGHSSSHILSRLAREIGLTVRALSRKKASWTFLPAPR
jgi:hypothetical protein